MSTPYGVSETAAAIRRAQLGDQQAITVLVDVFGPDVRTACSAVRFQSFNGLSLSDLMQEVWLRVWCKIGSFRGADGDLDTVKMFRRWLKVTTRNVTLNIIKKHQAARRQQPSAQHRVAVDEVQDMPRTEQRLDDRELIQLAIQELELEDRKIIELCFLDGIAMKDAAAELGITRDKIRYRMTVALDRLRFLLDRSNTP